MLYLFQAAVDVKTYIGQSAAVIETALINQDDLRSGMVVNEQGVLTCNQPQEVSQLKPCTICI